ncbi:DNA phosphorothioation-dependent restriction protein DptF [Paenisporosarcina quisquiliarum]|uniref:DNA phosphorothioation-dependent restriction protein DptF n=1 Tax=Paenisporosarcina quisquiliarum TaxID=365346 RepID=A0A9X3LI23_9BACL|nr:DNA phosphorothioation-dependent restriction protein DptF [Paenisporosarcina quisquiliarum]MCZ8538301.1 DNA phosphorothioation-dependent restriction protein DptF [Paenisporosarcina quisquiliarum]
MNFNGGFLNFLEDSSPIGAQIAKKMEDLIFEDPSSSIIKARVFAEEIISQVFKHENLEVFHLSLNDKISFLSKEGYFERDIQRSFDIIRLAGNKAAHDGQFNDITEAFKLHKEMYKIGVWFYEVYSLEQQLKIPLYEIPQIKPKENIEDIVRKQIGELIGLVNFNQLKRNSSVRADLPKAKINENIETSTNILTKDLQSDQSYLLRELTRLKDSSQEAIENASQFSTFKDYMHVDRKIQLDLENILNTRDSNMGNLILLCGSVGDGKSHLLAYLKEKRPELIKNYTIYNDATESFSPNKDSMETLEEILNNFSDEKINFSTDKIILAINMGVLHNFIYRKHENYTYNNLKIFVENSELFLNNITASYSRGNIDLLSFGDYHSYELTVNGPTSTFYSALINKVFSPSSNNPFYLALQEDEDRHLNTIVHENYKFMQNSFVQEQIIQLIIQAIIKKKLVISARAFLNFLADILIPDEVVNRKLLNDFEVLEQSLPNLLFNRRERSIILEAVSQLDPIHYRSVYTDQLAVNLNTLSNWTPIINEYIQEEVSNKWLVPIITDNNLINHSFNMFFEFFVRLNYLVNKEFSSSISTHNYKDYLNNLYFFNIGNLQHIRNVYEEIKSAIFKWKGSPKRDFIYLNNPSEKFRLSQKLNLSPTLEHLSKRTDESIDTFKTSIVLGYKNGENSDNIYLEIDFPLYQLLRKVQTGYRPNKQDAEDGIKFVEFIEKIYKFGDKKKEMLVHFPQDNKFYMVKRDDFGSFVFERE